MLCRRQPGGPVLRRLAVTVAALATLLASPAPALAWNAHGHMLIAAVAWQDLTPASRRRAAELLKRNPMYEAWVAGVPQDQRDEVAFMKAATWPDLIRTAPGYRNDDIASSGAAASQNIGYADHLVHPYWHYKTLPLSADGTPTHPAEAPNAQTQIAAFRQGLRARATSEAATDIKAYDLVWLEHLVSDVHQPLHAVSRFTRDAPGGDHGGGPVRLCPEPQCRDNLHGFWDAALGGGEDPQRMIAEAAALPRAPAELARISDEAAWLQESFTIAQNTVYAGPIGPTTGPYAVTPEYRAIAGEVSRGRAALAGARLARLINANLR